jgi:hypothetical protein
MPRHARAPRCVRCFCSAAGSGTACGAGNHFLDRQGYCVACGFGTAGADPKDRTKCLCKSGWGFFDTLDGYCTELSRRLRFCPGCGNAACWCKSIIAARGLALAGLSRPGPAFEPAC